MNMYLNNVVRGFVILDWGQIWLYGMFIFLKHDSDAGSTTRHPNHHPTVPRLSRPHPMNYAQSTHLVKNCLAINVVCISLWITNGALVESGISWHAIKETYDRQYRKSHLLSPGTNVLAYITGSCDTELAWLCSKINTFYTIIMYFLFSASYWLE